MNYVPYHVHDELSLLDSVTKFEDYVKLAKENNMKAIACTNHGNIYHWIERVLLCKKEGIKYLHGCEVYLTFSHKEKIRDNYHTVLIAKNKEGVKELNALVGLATRKDHMYYKPRLSFEEFLNIKSGFVDNHRLTIQQNTGAGSLWHTPRYSVSIGPYDVIHAREHLERHDLQSVGGYASWERMISRLQIYGPVCIEVPASIYQLTKGTIYVSEDMARPIEPMDFYAL